MTDIEADLRFIETISKIVDGDYHKKLTSNRSLLIAGTIDANVASIVIGHILYLDRVDPERDITLYVASAGGNIIASMAIYDVMKLVKPPVVTIGVAGVGGSAAVLVSAGEKGKRFLTEDGFMGFTQSLGDASGKPEDIVRAAREITRQQDMLVAAVARATGWPSDKIHRELFSDVKRFSPRQAFQYGLVDEILPPMPQLLAL